MKATSRLAWRRPGAPDEAGFAMIFALALVMLLGSISLLLLAQITSEVRQTQFAIKHEQTLNSAEAGLNAGLNRLRNAIDAITGLGVIAYLPCVIGTNHATIAGSVNAQGTQTWQTDIYYLNVDPSAMTTAQVNAIALPCPLALVPQYAYIVASGRQAALPGSPATYGDRTIHAVYQFTTSNVNGAGGQISYGTACWDAGISPVVGSPVSFQTCGATGSPSQSWFYRPDLTVRWQGDLTKNLCLSRTAPGPSSGTNFITLATCLGTGIAGTAYNSVTQQYDPPAKLYQEFPTQDAWSPATSNGGRNDGSCITSYNVQTGAYGQGGVGDRLVMASVGCSASAAGAARVVSSGLVGAGAASGNTDGYPGTTQQLANLKYASRCFDMYVSKPGVTISTAPLIHYTCGQAPNPALIPGNKRFVYVPVTATTGLLTTSSPPDYTNQCFESLNSVVHLATCQRSTPPPAQLWTLTGVVPLNYADSYTIRDYLGRCITADLPTERFGQIGSTSLQNCTGLDDQKWNAPPGGRQSQVRGVGES